MAVKRPSGTSAVTFFRLLAVAPDDAENATRLRLPADGGRGDEADAGQELAGEGGRVRHHLFRRALRHHVAAVDAGGGADVHHVVGGADGVLVVLHHDDGVAEVAEVLQRLQQAGVVALVEADRRLVQHVEHAGEAGADLRGKADALALAAGKGGGGAGEGEVVEADVVEELQALADLLEDAAGDLVLLVGQRLRQVGEPRSAARTESAATSEMSLRSSLTASASGFSRLPPHASQGFDEW